MSEEEVRALTPYEFRQLLGGYSVESSIDTDAINRIRQTNRIPGQDREEETTC